MPESAAKAPLVRIFLRTRPDSLEKGARAAVSRDGDWSETYACNLFDWHLKMQETLPWLTGSAQWIFKDFTTPLRVEDPVPRMNQKGVIERDMTKKEGYFVFQSYWTEEPMAHIYGHTWPVRWGAEGEARIVKVYSNCPTAELFVNGESVGHAAARTARIFPPPACAGWSSSPPEKTICASSRTRTANGQR